MPPPRVLPGPVLSVRVRPIASWLLPGRNRNGHVLGSPCALENPRGDGVAARKSTTLMSSSARLAGGVQDFQDAAAFASVRSIPAQPHPSIGTERTDCPFTRLYTSIVFTAGSQPRGVSASDVASKPATCKFA